MPTNDECPIDGCHEPTPWDMAAINFDGQYFCSPDCARKHLGEMERVPESITLHDPQYAVDRDELPPTVESGGVDITREVLNRGDARTAIGEAERMFPAEFRVAAE